MSSSQSFDESNRLEAHAGKQLLQAGASILGAIGDCWGAQVKQLTGQVQATGEGAVAIGHVTMQGVRELAAETSDVRHAVGQAGSAYVQREQDFDRTRPVIAAGTLVVPGVHELLVATMGGNADRHQPLTPPADVPPPVTPPVNHDATVVTPPVNHDATVATSTSTAGADSHHHKVKSGESYWSIAAEAGGTKKQIAQRSHALQVANHNEALLPGLELVGT